MLTFNGKDFRNLEEQVQKNKEDIAAHYNIDRVLADFGIRIIGQVATSAALPDPSTFTGEYGDAYAVGTQAPYTFYIWTRADVDAGYPEDYWFDIGELAIVGPQGPIGPIGPQGPRGESSRWWTTTVTPPTPSTIYKAGDMMLAKDTGNVYSYNGAAWVLALNIIGPTGPQGPQGIQGQQGPQGPQGQQGLKGDPAAFIQVAGIISSADQLPTPESLGDLKIAYLVGDNKDVYIQVGTTSETAQWNNIGPINLGTLVSVQGVPQNTLDMDKYIARINTSRLGVIAQNAASGGVPGSNYSIPVDIRAIADVIVRRNSDGCILVPTDPTGTTAANSAVNKTYVDREIANKKMYKHILEGSDATNFGGYITAYSSKYSQAPTTASEWNELLSGAPVFDYLTFTSGIVLSVNNNGDIVMYLATGEYNTDEKTINISSFGDRITEI